MKESFYRENISTTKYTKENGSIFVDDPPSPDATDFPNLLVYHEPNQIVR
jgi:hypothetical protein